MSAHATERSNREAMRRLQEILQTGRVETLSDVIHDDCVTDYPQSGERLVGIENIAAVIANYPGGGVKMEDDEQVVLGDEERYMMTPTFNVVKVQGTGDTLVSTTRSRYPDGTVWWVISVVHFRDGKIDRTQQYFAPEFEPPAWRAQWVERIPLEK